MANEKTQITIGTPKNPLQLSYPHLFEPHAINADQPAKYMATILIDKNDTETVNAVNRAMKAAAERGKGNKWGGKIPTKLRTALMDGDTEKDLEKYPEFAGKYYLNAKSSTGRKPPVLDAAKNPITDPSEIYGGVYVRALVSFYPYSVGGNAGIGCGLNGVQKVKDGDMFSGGIRAEDAFDVIEEAMGTSGSASNDLPWDDNDDLFS